MRSWYNMLSNKFRKIYYSGFCQYQRGTKPDVVVPIGRIIVQIESKNSAVGRIVPISTTDRCPKQRIPYFLA